MGRRLLKLVFNLLVALSMLLGVVAAWMWVRASPSYGWVEPLLEGYGFPRNTNYYVWWSRHGVGVAAPVGRGFWGIDWWQAVAVAGLLPLAWLALRFTRRQRRPGSKNSAEFSN